MLQLLKVYHVTLVFFIVLLFFSYGTSYGEIYNIPMTGQLAMGLSNNQVKIPNAQNLKFHKDGVYIGKGYSAPEIILNDWKGQEGTIAFWIQPVDWTLKSISDPLVFIRPLNTEGGSFMIFRRPGLQNICLYTSKSVSSGKDLVFIPFAYNGVKDWKKGQWHHIAFTWKANLFAKLYIDGNIVGKADNQFYFPKSFNGISFAGGNAKDGFGATGTSLIRDVYISEESLSEEQLNLLSRNYHPSSVNIKSEATSNLSTSNDDVNCIPFSSVKSSPVMDGVIKENEYSSMTQGFIDTTSHTAYLNPLSFYTASDEKFLYLAFSLQYPKSYKLNILASEDDDSKTINLGDQFIFMVRMDNNLALKGYTYFYFSFAPNNKIYDALAKVNWKMASVERDTIYKSFASSTSRIESGKWIMEARIPRRSIGLEQKNKMLFSCGFRFNNRLLTLKDHPVWFDHYQAFLRGRITPFSVKARFGDLNQGKLFPDLTIGNLSEKTFKCNVACLTDIPNIRETAQSFIVDKQVGVEVAVDSRKKLSEWQRSLSVLPNNAMTVGQAQKLDAPGLYMVRATVKASDGAVLYRHSVPFIYFEPISIQYMPVPSKDFLKIAILLYGLDDDFISGKSITLDFISEKNVSCLKKTFPVQGKKNDYQLSMNSLKPGNYDVKVLLSDERGKVYREVSSKFKKWDTPDWLKNPEGIKALSPDWAPAPWTPIKVDTHHISMWGKTFEFQTGSIISAIVAQGEAVLKSGGMTLNCQIGDKKFKIPFELPKALVVGKGQCILSQTGTAHGLTVDIKQQIEFDGMDYFTFTVKSANSLNVERIWIEIPFKNLKYIVSDKLTGLIENCDYTGPVESLWIGNDNVGCGYFAENYKGWFIDSRKPRVQLIRQDADSAILRLLLVNEPGTLPSEFSGNFGLLVTPIKPYYKNWRDTRVRGFAWSNYPTSHILLANHRWSAGYSLPEFRNQKCFDDAIKESKRTQQKVYPYVTPSTIASYEMVKRDTPFYKYGVPESALVNNKSEAKPVDVFWYFAEDWMYAPAQYNSHGNGVETTEIVYCSPNSSFADYFVGSLGKILRSSDLDGFYFDLSRGRRNYDPKRGYTYKTRDGITEGTFELMAMRNMVKRLYSVFDDIRGVDRKPYIISHGGYIPISSFYDMYLEGEGIKPSKKFDMTEVFLQKTITTSGKLTTIDKSSPKSYDAIGYRCLMGSRLGVPQILLPQYGYKKELMIPEHSRELLSFTFLHDTPLTPMLIPVEPVIDFWEKVTITFGMNDVEFHPYWNNGVKSLPDSVRVSYWKKDGKDDYLVATANWSATSVNAEISLPAEKFGSFTEAVNMETGDKIMLSNGKFTISIPAHDLQVIRIKK